MIRFFYRFLGVSTFLASLCLAYGFFIEPKRLVIREHPIDLDEYNAESLRIVVLADIHIGGRHMSPSRVKKIVERTNNLQPDLILIAGDFIDGHVSRDETTEAFDRQVKAGITAFKDLRATHGIYSVIGNHDVWYDADYVEASLEAAGVNVLTNEAAHITPKICVTGLADNTTQTEDPESFSACKPDSTIIALMHSPDSFIHLRSDVKLAVAGHTHAGQINIPFLGRLSNIGRLGSEYKYGLKVFRGIPVYISSGLGTSVLPARFRAPPEITILTLH